MNIPKMTFSQMGASTIGKTDADLGSLVFVTTTSTYTFNTDANVGLSPGQTSAPNYTFIAYGSGGVNRLYKVYGLWYLTKLLDPCSTKEYYVWRYIGHTNLGLDNVTNQSMFPTCYLYPPKPNMEAGEDHHLGTVVNVPDEEKPLIGPMEEDKVQGINSRK